MELAKLNRAAARKNQHTDSDARRLHGALWPRWCCAANASDPASLKSRPGLILDSRGQSTVYQAGVIWVSWLTEETGWKREDGAAAGGAPPAPPPAAPQQRRPNDWGEEAERSRPLPPHRSSSSLY